MHAACRLSVKKETVLQVVSALAILWYKDTYQTEIFS